MLGHRKKKLGCQVCQIFELVRKVECVSVINLSVGTYTIQLYTYLSTNYKAVFRGGEGPPPPRAFFAPLPRAEFRKLLPP